MTQQQLDFYRVLYQGIAYQVCALSEEDALDTFERQLQQQEKEREGSILIIQEETQC